MSQPQAGAGLAEGRLYMSAAVRRRSWWAACGLPCAMYGKPAGALHTTVTGRRCTQPWLAMLLQYDSSVLGLQVGDASCASVTAVLCSGPGTTHIPLHTTSAAPPPHLRCAKAQCRGRGQAAGAYYQTRNRRATSATVAAKPQSSPLP
jgi:hypothetical protein